MADGTSDSFAKITGQVQSWIKGESRKQGKEDWIIIDDYTYGANQPGSFGTNMGGSSGKTTFTDIPFSMPVSKASPLLFKAMCTGEHFSEVILTKRKSTGTNPDDYEVVTLTDAILTSYYKHGEMYSGQLNFKKIRSQTSRRTTTVRWDQQLIWNLTNLWEFSV